MAEDERGPRRIDVDAVRRDTVEYYDRRPLLGDAWASEPAGVFPDSTAEQELLQRTLREVVEGRRALELGCGTGDATGIAASTATSVLAIDSGPTCIRLAKQRTSLTNVEFRVGDAFNLRDLPGDFSAGFAVGLFHLMAAADQDAFLDGFHARLLPGSPVLLSASHTRTLRARKHVFRAEGSPDVFCTRTLTDGAVYTVINNEFTEADLRRIFEPRVNDLRVNVGHAWWWVTYRVETRPT